MLQVDEYVEALYPKLYLSPTYPVYLDIATSQTSAPFFGVQTNYAIALRACHNFYLDDSRPNGVAGAITGMTEGRTSISIWNTINKGTKSTLGLSTFGQRLQGLISGIGAGASITKVDEVSDVW